MDKVIDYVKSVLGELLYGKVFVYYSVKGFYTSIIGNNYEMYLHCYDLNVLNRLTIRHECGHVIAHEIIKNDPGRFEIIIKTIRKNLLFSYSQYIWYWNGLIRLFKILLGYSMKLNYGPNDVYDFSGFRYKDIELFCDWFALFGNRDIMCSTKN